MIGKTEFKKTLYLFKQESNILLRSSWDESPLPFKRFLDRIENEPEIKKYLDDCVANHTPEGFDVTEEVRIVSEDYHAVFGPFSTVPEEESVQVYLIIKELVANSVQGRAITFYGYAPSKFSEMYKGFLDKVVRRLIANVESYLTMKGIEMGLDGGDSVNNNFYGNMNGTQINQPSGDSAVNATQTNGISADDINTILNAILSAAADEIDDEETIEDVRDNVEIVRAQIESSEPRRGVVKGALGFLKGVNGGVQFAAAIAQLVQFFTAMGIQLPS